MTRIRFLAISFFLSVLVSCNGSPDRQLEAVIRNYNTAVSAGYRSGDTRPLRMYAGEKETNKVQVLIDIKLSNKLVLESELVQLQVENISPRNDGSYSVRTKERWHYHDRPLKAGASPGQKFVADMFLEYTIRQEGGVWKVQKVKAEKTNYIEPEDKRGNTARQ